MKTVNVQETKIHLASLIDETASGVCVLFAKYGKPVAKFSSCCPEREARVLEGMAGVIGTLPDFDDNDTRNQALFS